MPIEPPTVTFRRVGRSMFNGLVEWGDGRKCLLAPSNIPVGAWFEAMVEHDCAANHLLRIVGKAKIVPRLRTMGKAEQVAYLDSLEVCGAD